MSAFERIAVLDDEPGELELLGGILRDLGEKSPELFTRSEDFLAAARERKFDVAFLDVYLENNSGVAAAESLREISPETGIVFVTSSREHAVDAFRLGAVHYLVKPIKQGDVAEALSRFTARDAARPSMTLHVGRTSQRIYLDEIVVLQYVRHAVEVTTSDGGCFRVWTPLSELVALLDSTFLKINRGTVVNMSRVTRMEPDSCIMSDGNSFPISRSERPNVRERYNEFLVRELNIMVKTKRGGAI